jgi:hypothetical protein
MDKWICICRQSKSPGTTKAVRRHMHAGLQQAQNMVVAEHGGGSRKPSDPSCWAEPRATPPEKKRGQRVVLPPSRAHPPTHLVDTSTWTSGPVFIFPIHPAQLPTPGLTQAPLLLEAAPPSLPKKGGEHAAPPASFATIPTLGALFWGQVACRGARAIPLYNLEPW